jgi:hypothetical protein
MTEHHIPNIDNDLVECRQQTSWQSSKVHP